MLYMPNLVNQQFSHLLARPSLADDCKSLGWRERLDSLSVPA
jgi:hypothetical protein